MTDKALTIRDDMTLSELGSVLAKSGFFADTRDAAHAIVKVMVGRELGLQPIAAMTGIYIVQGRVSLSANILAALVKRSGRYDYRVMVLDDRACEISFFEKGEAIGNSRFTAEDAKRAGTKNMEKYPRNMLFARAMSNGVKWYCPDVTGGPVYTPEEMGAAVNEDGDMSEMPAVVPAPNGNDHAEAEVEPVYAEAQIDKDFDAPVETVPYPGPVTETIKDDAPKFAVIKGLAHATQWQKAAKELALKYPKYQTVLKGGAPGGQPNFHHILGAAAKCGYAEVNDGNFELVIEAVAKRAAELAQVAA